ncbi:hypothetical protein BFAG_03524 [Bacteroides fragilis 3_1_12]|uniref:Uncharacterized protein n=1 Tax=Bacteroides fragilis 3_1_12 TaxID=457424 RepID=A0ABN0BPJ4_BACFG|nr:hypothetical protein BFAG_03524 [Bacteroides fragilis 3_1_12]
MFFLIKASKKDNYQLENKEIKNLPPNLKKNHFLYERKQVMYLNLFLFSLKLFSSFTD